MGKSLMTVDGNTAAAYVAYAFTEVAAIYPITPSSTMAEIVDEWAARGRENIFGQSVNVTQMQSESGAAGAFHGALQGGALTTTFTASQGLLLMIPNMYKVAGELLPGVFHVSARALAAQALSIFGDHQDVMAARQTGCAFLATSSVQEIMDLAPVAHLAALEGRIPFVHFFDGFRTSHEIQKVEALGYDDLAGLLNREALQKFRDRALSPNHPVIRGTAQNPDIYFQTREASNKFYKNLVPIVAHYMAKINTLTGRNYDLFNYYGAQDADEIIIAMGSITETIRETVETLNARGGRYGVVSVHLYRPFSKKHLLSCIPKTVRRICVLDRTKEPGALGEPLYLDVKAAFYGIEPAVEIIGGRFGLGSKDTTPADIKAVFDNLSCEHPKNGFTVGITDDVEHTSLVVSKEFKLSRADRISCLFWGLGSDGTVGANKQAIKIIGNHTDQYVQAYFDYDSKKSGGLTMSHLRFGKTPIHSPYLIKEADYVACHNQSYINQYDILDSLKEGGIFVLNCLWDKEEINEKLPLKLKRELSEKKVQFYIINAFKIASEIGLGNRINMVMQAVFFKLTEVILQKEAKEYLKEAVQGAYGKKGEKVIRMNEEAIDRGFEEVVKIEIPQAWKDEKSRDLQYAEPEFITKILRPMSKRQGDQLPVSIFNGIEDGTFPTGTAAYEKRGIAIRIPKWIPENCIQCNQCSFICPHATIRPFLLTEKEAGEAPSQYVMLKAIGKGLEKFQFRIQVAPMDCTGCGNCVDICPGKKGQKALEMELLEDRALVEVPNWAYCVSKIKPKENIMPATTVKGSQFKTPLYEFSGACAGCGEPAYVKLMTQLFGDRMMIANATGCSSIWSASAPSIAYTVNDEGKGPSWANSLFEDNAEYGYGMYLAVRHIRKKLEACMRELLEKDIDEEARSAFEEWLRVKEEGEASKNASRKVEAAIASWKVEGDCISMLIDSIKRRRDYLVKRSIWMIGGDGWAYDIGYGGLDHVMASGADVNILIYDTEIYSNTGGQSSKATPAAAIAKFAASGKKTRKKDLGLMMMTYGNVYVAQVAMGADKQQCLKAIREAEAYKGPSVIIAYAPCISHGLKTGMGHTSVNQEEAVKCGYWHLYRFNPELKAEGKNPFVLDSKEPTESFRDFIMNQVRYVALQKQFPRQADELFEMTEHFARQRYEHYKMLSQRK